MAVTLGVVLTATYPKTPPRLSLTSHDELREQTLFKIQSFLDTKPKQLTADEQPMIDGIVEGIREILDDAAQAKAAGLELPSLEEERAAHEALLAKQAEEKRMEEEKKKKEETLEEERALGDLVQKELQRQQEKRKQQKGTNGPNSEDSRAPADPDRVTFDQTCKMTDNTGNSIQFSAVTGKLELRKGTITTIYTVRPIVAGGQKCPNLVLKETILRSNGKDPALFKKQLQNLESHLESLKKVHHRNLLDILDFRIDREVASSDGGESSSLWKVSVLSPEAEKGPLGELLDLAGTMDITKVRSWTIDLLDALNFLHNSSLVHQSIHPGNILLFRESSGEIVPKLSDAMYQKELHNICVKSQATPGLSSPKSAYWLPPEIAGTSKPHYTQKTDVWDFGVVVLQMIFGMDVPEKYHSPSGLIDSLPLSHSLHELVSKFFKPDPKKRPRAFELGSSEFLATDAPALVDDTSAVMSSIHSLSSNPVGTPSRLRRESTNRNMGPSRYKEDFTEETVLGKGGFGVVVKARKKLDGMIYAIKKITLRSQATLSEVLKEVRLLSQSSHPAVVRYYNAWYEELPEFSDTEGDTSTEDLNTEEESRDTVDDDPNIQFATSTGGLDFMSSSGYPQVEFGYDDSDGEEDESGDSNDEEDEDEDEAAEVEDGVQMIDMAVGSPEKVQHMLGPKKARFQRPHRTILYIAMEYCEKRVCHLNNGDS
jgi:eukaryotic translation initiation factor 2-alpha kinase 4